VQTALREPAAARAEGRIGGRRKKLDVAKRREIAESVITGPESGAEMARFYNVSQPTVSRIVTQHRMASPSSWSIRKWDRGGGAKNASFEEAAPQGCPQEAAQGHGCSGVAGPPGNGELPRGYRRTEPR
jgi:hypothetical protein